MSFSITSKEKERLQDLAKKQMEYANLPVMKERAANWLALNTGKPAVPPVVIETLFFGSELVPNHLLQCENEAARSIEFNLLTNILNYELIDDDKVMPNYYGVFNQVKINKFGVAIPMERASDSKGRDLGFKYDYPISDLEKDFHLLKPAKCSIDREATKEHFNFVNDTLGSIMPVRMAGNSPSIRLINDAFLMVGMEDLFIAFHEQPELVHKLMAWLTENQINIMRFYENEGLLNGNTGNQETGMSSFGFTDEITLGNKVMLKDVWVWTEAQEAASISPETFIEFCLPYYAKAAELFGLIYYGCCEPVHGIWQELYKAIPNIRKVSISPWCDEKLMSGYLRGTNVVYSRKPSPNFIGVDTVFDEDGWKQHIAETFNAAKGCQCEIIMRDIYQTQGMETVKKAVQIAKGLAKE